MLPVAASRSPCRRLQTRCSADRPDIALPAPVLAVRQGERAATPLKVLTAETDRPRSHATRSCAHRVRTIQARSVQGRIFSTAHLGSIRSPSIRSRPTTSTTASLLQKFDSANCAAPGCRSPMWRPARRDLLVRPAAMARRSSGCKRRIAMDTLVCGIPVPVSVRALHATHNRVRVEQNRTDTAFRCCQRSGIGDPARLVAAAYDRPPIRHIHCRC